MTGCATIGNRTQATSIVVNERKKGSLSIKVSSMSSKTSIATIIFALLFVVTLKAQQQHHAADFEFSLEDHGSLTVGGEAQFIVKVTPAPGWHIYSAVDSEEGVYSPTGMEYDIISRGFEVVGNLEEEGKIISEMDDIMGGMMRYYKTPATFIQTIKITEEEVKVIGYVDYMACDEMKCVMLTEAFELAAEAAK